MFIMLTGNNSYDENFAQQTDKMRGIIRNI